MELHRRGIPISYTEHGRGIPLVALHGVGVDSRELEAALEPVLPHTGYRRVYPDLPGMGRTTADGIASNNDVVALLGDFLEAISDDPVLLVGHSYGAYLARGIAAARPDGVRGLALFCPFTEGNQAVPEQRPVRQDDDAYDDLEPQFHAGFDEYFVVRTRATARRYEESVLPGTTLVDAVALERIFSAWTLDLAEPYRGPTLIVAGRNDSTVGYAGAIELSEHHPLATLAVLDGTGHALLHEQPELVAALLNNWLSRTA